MVRPEVILAKLERLDEYLGILKRLQRYSRAEFLAEAERYGSAERFLQLAIECLIDIGNHVVSDGALGATDWASDIPRRLCEAGIVDAGLRDVWVKLIGFRNVLVHEYVRLDRALVHDMLATRLGDFDNIRKALARLL
jgi:uncharacterized protein YutE (UPF0331/DUF86 family)